MDDRQGEGRGIGQREMGVGEKVGEERDKEEGKE